MIFLNPLFLFGLAAAAIPFVIHLFNFRRPKRIDFSTLAFLHELQKTTMQRVRIKQWLLLVMRTLIIAALVVAFARPTFQADFAGALGGRSRASMVLIVDNSPSMLLRDGFGVYLEQARTIGLGLIDQMQNGDEIFVLPTITISSASAAFQDESGAKKALLSIEAESGHMRLSASIREAAALLSSSANPNREIYLLSDLQASTLIDSVEVELPVDTRVFLIPVGEREHDNIAVSGLSVLSRILAEGQVVRMVATLANHGKRSVSDLVVSVYLDDSRVGRATTDLGPGEVVRVPISVTPRKTGWLKGRIEIDDGEFASDDSRRFTLFVPEERKILIVVGRSARTEYVELALSESLTGSRVRFDVRRIDESQLAGVPLGTYDTVIMSGVVDLSSGERTSLTRYVEAGGGLLVFPGDEIVVSDYNDLFEKLNGGTLAGPMQASGDRVSVAGFERIDVEHPLFEGMFEELPAGRVPTLEQPDFYRLMLYSPGSGNEQTLVHLSGDWPFLQEIRSGLGSLLLFAVAPEESWSDFPVRGLFIPLLYRSIYYLSAGGSVTGEEFSAGAAGRLRLTGIPEDQPIVIESETGESYIPDLRRVPGALLVSIDAGFLKPGFFEVRKGEHVLRRVVVHPVPEESDLESLTPDEGIASLSAATGRQVVKLDLVNAEQDQLQVRLESARTGVELWNVFLMLALVTLMAEMIIEKKWRPEAA